MRVLGCLVCLALAAISSATDALVLIAPSVAGPVDLRGEWVLWPPADSRQGSNRLLSLLTGLDWAGSGNELIFAYRDGIYVSTDYSHLRDRGYISARSEFVKLPAFAISDSAGMASRSVLLLALGREGASPVVRALGEPWPNQALAIGEADSWDAADAIVHKAGGRCLIVEYPPPDGQRWSRFWMRGRGWPARLPMHSEWRVPGLIPASDAGKLLLEPGSLDWHENDVGDWGGANRWLGIIRYAGPLTLALLGFVLALFVGCTVYLISREQPAVMAGGVLEGLMLAPAAILASGTLSRAFGPDGFPLWLALAYLALLTLSWGLRAALRRTLPEAHPALGLALAGFAVSIACPPLWSIYSNVLGPHTLPVSTEAVGAIFAYLVGVCTLGRGSVPATWLGRILAAWMLAWGVLANPWWVGGAWQIACLPGVAALAGEQLLRYWMAPIFVAIPLADRDLATHGAVWAPGDLYWEAGRQGALNLARHAEFLTSPGFVGAALLGGLMLLFTERFFFHQVRRALLLDARLKAPFMAALVAGAMALFQPLLFHAAFFCLVGGVLLVLSDAARAR